MILGRWSPRGALAAALLFGFADAIGFRLQSFGLPQQLTDAGPYVITLIVLVLLSSRFRKSRQAQLA